MSISQWLQLLVAGITAGAVYGLIGLGYVTVFRTSRVVNMAQGSFVMLGALLTYSFFSELGWPFWLAAPAAILVVVGVSLLMYTVVIAPIMKVSLVAMILATIGVGLLLENLALLRWGGYGKSVPFFTGDTPFIVGGVAIRPQSLWVLALTLAVLALLHSLSNYTLLGKRMTASASNPVAAGLCGVSTRTMVLLAFGLSAAIGALGGIAIGSLNPVSYLSGGIFGLNGFVAAILGGWGSSAGAVVGGLTLGVTQAVAIGVLPAGYKDAIAFLLLLLILYFRPSGLLNVKTADLE
jgi:branched-chain amino acid transport system permease protein